MSEARDPEAAAQAKAQGEAVLARQQAAYEAIIAEGRAIDPLTAMARCFASGNHGTERLKG